LFHSLTEFKIQFKGPSDGGSYG